MPNVSHENHLIFMRMTVQVTYIFIPIVSLKDSFSHRGKSKLGIGLFIHELLRQPLICLFVCLFWKHNYLCEFHWQIKGFAPISITSRFKISFVQMSTSYLKSKHPIKEN